MNASFHVPAALRHRMCARTLASCRASSFCTDPRVSQGALSGHLLHAAGMDGLTADDLLADAVGCVALDVLRRLAGDADARSWKTSCD
jgi:hypothetical protein